MKYRKLLNAFFALSAVAGSITPCWGAAYHVDSASEDKSFPEFASGRYFLGKIVDEEVLPAVPRITVLGWDTGRLSEFAANKCLAAEILNLPLNPDFVPFAETHYPHPRVKNRYLKQEDLPTELEQSTDLLFSTWVVGFIPEDQQLATLHGWHATLKKTGLCAVMFPVKGSLLSQTIERVVSSNVWKDKFDELKVAKRASYSAAEYAQLMRQAGFQSVRAHTETFTVKFDQRSAFVPFVRTAISRFVPFLNPGEIELLVNAIINDYIANVPGHSAEQNDIPYSVNMVYATGRAAHSIPIHIEDVTQEDL